MRFIEGRKKNVLFLCCVASNSQTTNSHWLYLGFLVKTFLLWTVTHVRDAGFIGHSRQH